MRLTHMHDDKYALQADEAEQKAQEQEQQQKEAEESERQSQLQQQHEQDEKLQQQADEAEQKAQEQEQQREEEENLESPLATAQRLFKRANSRAEDDQELAAEALAELDSRAESETARSDTENPQEEQSPERRAQEEYSAQPPAEEEPNWNQETRGEQIHKEESKQDQEELSATEAESRDGHSLRFREVAELARHGELGLVEHGFLAVEPELPYWSEQRELGLRPNCDGFPQTEQTELWGANHVEQGRILEALEYIPKVDHLPEVCEFFVENVPSYQNPDGTRSSGIQGIANTSTNQIFLNRENLSLYENQIIKEPMPQYRQGVAAFQQRTEAIEGARKADDNLWRETIWHEVAHIHDAYLGFDGKCLSEGPKSPFGSPPWPTDYAEKMETAKEDFAESYSELLKLRRENHLNGSGEEGFLRRALRNTEGRQKNEFILRNCWGYNL